MPIFDYRCLDCEAEFEFLVRPNKPAPTCPDCQSFHLEKMIAAPAVSSDSTKERARTSGLARNKKIGAEKARADHEYYHKHRDH